jgi:hypothetical protein
MATGAQQEPKVRFIFFHAGPQGCALNLKVIE